MAEDRQTEIGGVFKEYAGFVNQALTGAEKYTLRCRTMKKQYLIEFLTRIHFSF